MGGSWIADQGRDMVAERHQNQVGANFGRKPNEMGPKTGQEAPKYIAGDGNVRFREVGSDIL